MSWNTLQLRGIQEFVAPLDAAVGFVGDAVTTINNTLSAVANVLDVVAILITDDIDTETLAVKAVASSITAILDSFGGTTAAHILNVRLQKASSQGIAKKIVNSIDDARDQYRPMYGKNDAIAGVAIVYGSTSDGAYDLIKDLLSFQNLFGKFTHGLEGNTMPTPKGLRAEIITTPYIDSNSIAYDKPPVVRLKETGGSRLDLIVPASVDVRSWGRVKGEKKSTVSIKLQWDARPELVILEPLGGLHVSIKKVHIFKNTENMDAKLNSGFVKKTQLSVESYDSYDYNAINPTLATYVDDNIDEEKDEILYYAVGYEAEIGLAGEETQPLDVFFVSRSVRVNVAAALKKGELASNVTGTPPDWQALPNPLQLIPGFNELILKLKGYVGALEDTNTGASTQLNRFIEFIRKLVATNTLAITDLLETITQLVNILGSLNLAASVYSFASESGGNDYLRTTLFKALTDTTDPDRPAFDNPVGVAEKDSPFIVGALVLVTGGGNLASLAPATGIFNLLSSSSNSSTFDKIGSELASIESKVDDSIAALKASFSDSFEQEPLATASTTTASFSANLTQPDEAQIDRPGVNVPTDPKAGTAEDVTINTC